MAEGAPSSNLPLRTVSKLTGLSPDVLRAWEKRYQVVTPGRGPRGTRLYSGDDVVHLRLLAGAVAAGRSIGDVVGLGRAELESLSATVRVVDELNGATPVAEPGVRVLREAFDAIELFDSSRLHRILSDAMLGLGIERFVDGIATPLLRRVGDLWSQGRLSVADEHLVSGVLRGLLSGVLHSRGPNQGQRVLIATPSGERHEFGTLIAALIAADGGLDVVYLGADTPSAEIADAADRCGARVVVLGIVNAENADRATNDVRAVAGKLPITTELWLGGASAAAVAARVGNSSIRVMPNLGAVRAEVVRLRAERSHAV
jgi:hypothetical protein